MSIYAVWTAPTDTEWLTDEAGPLTGTLFNINNEGALLIYDDAYARLAALPEGADGRIEHNEYGRRIWIGGYAHPVSELVA